MSTAVESFIKKYQTARNYNSKEIRLTISEADELASALALVLANVNSLNTKIIHLQDQILENRNEIQVSGGTFS
jgi:hypothetical protein